MVNYIGYMEGLIHLLKYKKNFVDLTEVEAIIRSYEGVLDCVVVAVLKGSILVLKTLVVYMYEHLCRESLIGHIVESATIPITKDDIVRVERLPMTLSGKIDRKQATEILSK
jgi:acyl-coenzyme A synthetase/AMP-(fatty) acid ligase